MTVEIIVDARHEQKDANAAPARPITNRFLFVNVAAMRAKQLHRGAKPRLDGSHAAMLEQGKAERIAMGQNDATMSDAIGERHSQPPTIRIVAIRTEFSAETTPGNRTKEDSCTIAEPS